MQHTLIILKPDAVKRRLLGPIISRFEHKGLCITAMRMLHASSAHVDEHYKEHINKSFYEPLKNYFLSGKIVVMIVSGKNVVEEARRMIGSTNPQQAVMGTIRGDYGMETGRNLVHGSDSVESAKREIGIWFGNEYEYKESFDHSIIYE